MIKDAEDYSIVEKNYLHYKKNGSIIIENNI